MFDLLATEPSLATELIERTSSSLRVQGIVQLSLAPVFLLAAIGAVLNVMNARLMWIVDGIDLLENAMHNGTAGIDAEQMPALRRRQDYAQNAVNLCTASALTICLIVSALFISAFIKPQIGTFVAICWIVTMALLFVGLLFFVLETRIATSSARDRRKLSRKILRQHQQTASSQSDNPDSEA
ncbi:DUF2721 domain-containing protein [Altererythrobacter confluentis]|uniref:DUF2721 domain-containing protein n=1 Tax=Allopontixanthobacter confluentis TaxID=1849021 RepID=A0A6L7GCX1_9SPHN|nr:DUF2721 domain-containing protein [Allopontixanthobacter confluentis]MXP13355.1 DUF2721 domain-containing protein [Allopontixanthobacter confluentis]